MSRATTFSPCSNRAAISLDNEPIDDTLGAFADPQSNASFIFQADPFFVDRLPSAPTASKRTVLSRGCMLDRESAICPRRCHWRSDASLESRLRRSRSKIPPKGGLQGLLSRS